ncbi:AraC family transcriptional regulator [Actinomadura parmotrematis]|uniref:Helix-turn-helix transcriptional regulator n=1 Tax=Actinomadura parmotrematis TaxID=2864039 RepID=A0ABS7FZQ9_9ACTN|nr:helix-turn-helix transcriptional regulator [Actinomadura parmotrematis]MBW8485928.1 helix-turn-helix transcriptional regulator [Actinomadura parmotrematis]
MSQIRQHPDGTARLIPLASRERVGWHVHPHHQLAHPSRGVLEVSTGAGSWIVPPHRAVWLPAGIAHAHEAHGPAELRTVNFPGGRPVAGLVRPTVLAVSPLLREVIVALTAGPGEALADGPRRNLLRVALDQLREVRELPLHLPLPADDRLRAVAAALAADPADPRGLAAFGRAVGASERTLSRLFRRETGMSFPQWRTQVRLHRALIMLAGGASVTGTAAACGYATPSAFVQAFRTAFGTTPGRFGDDRSR